MSVKSLLYDRIFIYFLLFMTCLIVWSALQKIKVIDAEEAPRIPENALPSTVRDRNIVPGGY